MSNDALPNKVRQNFSVQKVGVETLVYDELRHRAFCLNRTSSAIWRMCDGTRTVANMAEAATLELGAPVSDEVVRLALADLRRDGLVEAELAPAIPAEISRRRLLRTLGATALLLPSIAAVAPLPAAAQYNGCFDCTDTPATGSAAKPAVPASILDQRKEAYKQLQKAKEAQQNRTDPFRLKAR